MTFDMPVIYLAIAFSPLVGALIAGLLGKVIGRAPAHWVTILGVGLSFLLSLYVFKVHVIDGLPPVEYSVYTWGLVGDLHLEVGFLIDNLTSIMMIVVTFVSLMVHIYTIGYMHDDPGYQRFFSYISFFTFSMLMLVMSNNFLQLFFGWEAVGLASYLLIGFWFKKESAIFANFKAFIVNRVGDLGFLLGIGVILAYCGSLNYAEVFGVIPQLAAVDTKIKVFSNIEWSVITLMCILLFIGAMGKSAQMPLHVWLPDSMEGPTPISALIHAATMVTAGVFMVVRLSPIFEFSTTALSFILIIGSLTALLMGFVGIVQNDIKRVIAYSTLSQLGYMMVAVGASAYAAGIFHLVTHAFFKALLFLAAGSVIIGMHHQQDMRHMGGLRKYMPITTITALIGSLALMGFPLFSGFYSKDAIISAVHLTDRWGADFAYWSLVVGVFVTALYSFRLYFLVFHTSERMDAETRSHIHESPAVVWMPLVLLAIPSVLVGWFYIEPMLFASNGILSQSIFILPEHDVLARLSQNFHGPLAFALHGLMTLPVWLGLLGLITAWVCYVQYPKIPGFVQKYFKPLYRLLDAKYGFDLFNEKVLAKGTRLLGQFLWRFADARVIDGWFVNGSAKLVGIWAKLMRKLQSGYVYHYALAMLLGLILLLCWLIG